jgi:periplasmic protein CpxP/Spy
MNRVMIVLVIGILGVLAPIAVPAQMMKMPEGGMGGGEMGLHEKMGMHEGMGMDGGMMGMMRMMMAVDHLDLTPDQRKKIRTLRLEHQKEAIPLMGKIRMAGVETEELMMADPVDLEKVKAKTKEKYETMADLEISHLALEQEIKAVLTPEQRQKLDAMMEMRHGGGHGMDQMKGSMYDKPAGRNPHKPAPGQPPKMDQPAGR